MSKLSKPKSEIIKCVSRSILPVKINFNGENILVMNTYFPTDKQGAIDYCLELSEVINYIKEIIASVEQDWVGVSSDLKYLETRHSANVRLVKTLLML